MDIESMTFHPEPSGQARATAADSLDGLPLPQRYWAMLTIAVAVSMTVLDAVIANVALPTIARDVGASPAASIWVVNAYQLALVISLLPLSSLGDIVGYRKVYQSGFAVFTIASLCCALSHSLISLGIARFIQGLGAAGIVSVNTALIRTIFPSKILGRGLGINAMVVAVSAAIGPTFAAGILSLASWPWLFAVNVPVGILGLGISLRTLPRSGGSGHRFDLKSALLSGLTFGLLMGGGGRDHRGYPHRYHVRAAPVVTTRPVVRGRSAAAANLRLVGRHFGLLFRRPNAGLRILAFLFAKRPGPLSGRMRTAHLPMAIGDSACRPGRGAFG
jgi:MFS family permease